MRGGHAVEGPPRVASSEFMYTCADRLSDVCPFEMLGPVLIAAFDVFHDLASELLF